MNILTLNTHFFVFIFCIPHYYLNYPQLFLKGGSKMFKRIFCLLMVFLFSITFTITINTPLLAKEQKEEELEKYTLEQLLNLEITTAGKKKEKISDIPASVVVMTREDIETYGYQTLEEILKNIPGLYLTNDYSSYNLGVRGFWTVNPQRNLTILVNDIPQTEYLLNSNLLELINIPVEAIDRIEVVRGPMSVMYGTGAFFGVINIKTNIVKEYNPISLVSASAGSEKTTKLVARVSGKTGDIRYSFNSSYYDTYGIDKSLSKIVNDPAILPSIGLKNDHKTGGQLENEEKYFNFSGAFKGFLFDASYSESNKEVLFFLPSIADGTIINYRALRFCFGYQKNLSDIVRAEAKLAYFMNKWTFDFDMLVPNFYGTQANGSSGYKADFLLFIDASPNLNITLGVSYNNVVDVVTEFTVPAFGLNLTHYILADEESIITQSIYSQFNWKISDKLKIVGGLRLEQTPEYIMEQKVGNPNILDPFDPDFGTYSTTQDTYSYTNIEFIPRLALIYALDDQNYFKFLYGKAINRPSFFQNTQNYGALQIIPVLKPETTQTFELNYIGNLSSYLSISLSLFHNILDKLIYRTLFVVGDVPTSSFGNVGEMTTNGIEFTLTLRPSLKFDLELSGTYQDTIDKRPGFEDIEPGYSPKFLGYIKTSYFFTRDISLAITGNYVDKMYSFWDSTLENPDGANGRRLGKKVGGYFLLGANLRIREIFGTGFFLNIRGSNLLDQEIRFPATSNNSNFAFRGTIGRGISFLVSLGYQF